MEPARVVIVDPDEHLAASVSQILTRAGLDTRVAFGADSGCALVLTTQAHLVLVDAFLPGTGGPGLVRRLRQTSRAEPLAAIYMIPSDRITPAVRSAFSGLDDFILKPLHVPSLVERIYRLLLRMERLPEVLADLGQYGGRFAASQGIRRADLSVLFADVRGFTRFSETRDPETIASTLNGLFEHLAAAVLRHGGVIDKFIGDGIMGVFEPSSEGHAESHALAGVRAAEDMLRSLQHSHAVNLLAGANLAVGVGLHSGAAVVGPIGPLFRRDNTAVGDTVNMASRLCSEAQAGELVVSKATLDQVKESVRVLAGRDVALKGKREPQRIFSVRLRTGADEK